MKNILRVSVLMLSLSIFLTSCSDDDDSSGSSISDSNLSGMVRGENFTAVGGKASFLSDVDRFETEDEAFNIVDVSINITNIVADCESDTFDYDLYVSSSVPFEVGTYEDANVVFWKEGETPLNVFQSTVIIEEITETTITVKIESESSSEDTVEGTFTVDYCN